MNKILVNGEGIANYNSSSLYICDNLIFFIDSGDYYIEYNLVKNNNLKFKVKDDINVNIYEYDNISNFNNQVLYEIGKKAGLNIYRFGIYKSLQEDVTINLDGEESHVKYVFSSLNYNSNNYKFTINHNSSNSISNVYNQILSFDKSNVKFIIDSILPKGRINTYINQASRGINLGNSSISIEPNMIIDEEDTTAKHSSVIGKEKEDIIFYLMSRGIKEQEARVLLIKGFLLHNLDFKFDFKEKIISNINKLLEVKL